MKKKCTDIDSNIDYNTDSNLHELHETIKVESIRFTLFSFQ